MGYELGSRTSGNPKPAKSAYMGQSQVPLARPQAGAPSPFGGGQGGAVGAAQNQINQNFQAMQGLFQQGASGQGGPYSQAAQSALRSQAGDQTAAMAQAQLRSLNQSMANRGFGTDSGAAIGRRMDIYGRAAGANRAANRDIDHMASVANYQAQQRDRENMMRALGLQSEHLSRTFEEQQDPWSEAFANSLMNGGGGGAFGGGGGGGGAGGGGFDGGGWDAIWAAQNAQDEAMAQQRRQDYGATYDPSRPVGTRAGYQPAGSKSPYGGILGMMWGSGGAGDQGPSLDMAPLDRGGGFASISGEGGNYSGSPEDVLSQIRRGPQIAWGSGGPGQVGPPWQAGQELPHSDQLPGFAKPAPLSTKPYNIANYRNGAR